jgi:dTDP-4-amino-4,6-dideoxygalactose transaminase
LLIIEDAAQAHLAKYYGENIGTLGDAACFSFYPGKNLGAYGDAGAILTSNEDFAKKARMIANHGRILKYEHEFEGRNSRMDGLQAAILSAKLPFLNKWTEKRREVAGLYNNLLKGIGDIVLPFEPEAFYAVYHLYVIKTGRRDELKNYLQEKGIAAGIHYPIGLPFQPAYKYLNHSLKDFPVTAKNQDLYLSLPIFPEITKEQIEYVVENIVSFYQN